MSASPRAPLRRWLARLIVLALAGTLAFALAEIATRILYGKDTMLFPRYHTGAQYGAYRLRRLRPSTTFLHTSADGTWEFRTNAQGFRDTRDYHYEKPPGTRRILCLGDSHTQGFESRQDATFSAVLERTLAQSGSPAEVLNTGISGFGTAEQLAFLENEGARYAPDVVVLAFFANDLDDSVKSGLFRVENGALIAAKMEHIPGVAILDVLNALPPLRWLSEHSYFYSLLFNRVWEARKGLLSQRRSAAVAGEFAIAPAQADAALAAYQRELVALLVRRMHAVCAERGIRFVIVEIPSWKRDGDFTTSIPPELNAVLAREGDAFLPAEDTLGAYRGATEWFVRHGQHHISAETHRLLGTALAGKIAPWLAPAGPAP